MFAKLLIANRGEIACRIMRTAKRMGIATVAVYSEADEGALHVHEADEALCVGPAAAAESYLVIERVVEAARTSGAEAVHPGYGFLAENEAFAAALEAAGIAFIGPGADAIRVMGDKIEAKKLAREAGVNTIPGHLGAVSDADEAVRIAREIGYPVMIKATAGGGGKGMRLAGDEAETREGFERAASEALSSFGDGRLFIEKFIRQPRHIEIQVLADGHGNVIHLGERECSIQRRHQKVIEEAPSPFLDEATRQAMGAQAVALARQVGYRSAGTVEFIVDAERQFYFLEMNTRLQVEHPVTELVTGIDLVEQMIRVAAGESLSLTQKEVVAEGWAIECRIYAEDPRRGFLPSVGRLKRYLPPPESTSVRIDSGVREGSEISVFYDPLIAKLCTYGANREEAIEGMRGALDAFHIRGLSHNISFLAAVAGHPRFRQGEFSTEFIAETYPDGFHGADLEAKEREALMAVAVLIHSRHLKGAAASEWVVEGIGEGYRVEVAAAADGGLEVALADRVLAVDGDWRPGDPVFRGRVDGRGLSVQVEFLVEGYRLGYRGAELAVTVRSPRVAELAALMPVKIAADTSNQVRSPMPGLVLSISVNEGQEIKAGETVAVIEAMKMENVLRAERDGTVARVLAEAGQSLVVDQVILEFA